ncbi:uncharacterized protein PAC_11564 [Phialocephala subalpina]|uniref:Uncharacterized protein n=1 Tax=Phialocephala subalpina TaxID=576137 RepID=A0A1L7X9L1_9HELO|nr:uncharacterized protein PAC_11564 [Phialocephala subalpina]
MRKHTEDLGWEFERTREELRHGLPEKTVWTSSVCHSESHSLHEVYAWKMVVGDWDKHILTHSTSNLCPIEAADHAAKNQANEFSNSNPPPPPVHRDSKFRPASSIYSQPSPNPITTRFQNSYADYTQEEVSPPSSPEYDRPNHRSQQHEPDVSPIDEMPDVSRLGFGRPPSRPGSSSKPPSSNIPVLRREKRRNQIAAAANNLVTRKEVGDSPKGRIAHDPRWDPYTGEITTSDRGKPQSAKPGQFTAPGLRPVHKETGIALGNESNVTSGAKAHTSFGDRVRRLKSNNTSPTEQPPWRGATGRTTLVSPVKDQYDIAPLNIPRKSSKRVASPTSGSQSGASTPVTIIRSGDGETSPASAQMPERIDPTIRTVLSNSGQNSPRVVESPVTITPDPVVAPLSAATRLARGNTDPVRPQPPSGFEREDTLAGIERNFREAIHRVGTPKEEEQDPYEQPPSRFSVSTYAPSQYTQGTPRPSDDYDRPPMPTPPTSYAFEQPSSILDRKRPPIGGVPNISRKAVNPSSPVFISMSSSLAHQKNRQSTASNLTTSTAKNLPMTPSESSSHDLVSQLQAQLDNLAHRRTNIERSIRQMTELMPKDHLTLTEEVRAKREIEKMKVEQLRVEEADVRREEHDIGLRLHRAWKRRDKEAVYEPTGLWVRRVTGMGKHKCA